MKDIKTFFEEGKNKRWKKTRERYQNFTEEEKQKRCWYYQECEQKLPGYRRNYYITHKVILRCFEDFSGPGTI